MNIPVGSITLTQPGAIPEGSLECDGRAVDATEYASLLAVIGEVFGSNAEDNTFNIPGPFDSEALGGLIAVIKY